MSMDKVVAIIDGKEWQGWTGTTITRSLKALAGEIRLTVTRKWSDAKVMPLAPGLPIQINIGSDRVATGYISEFIPSYDDKSVRYELVCHDKTVDLVDCSVVHSSGEWKNVTLATIAKDVCQPFDIDVVIEADVGAAFTTVRLEQGETGFELLERLSRQRAVLLTSNAYGNLVITTASTRKLSISLALGQNIRAARGRFSKRESFDQVIVKGLDESWKSNDPAQTGGQAVVTRNKSVTRYRPHIILMEESFTVDGASRRGQWQIASSAAKANTTEITVDGWRMGADPSSNTFTGELWPLNVQLTVIDPIQGIDAVLLISQVSFIENDEGRVSILSLVPPAAMKVEPIKSPTANIGWKTSGANK